MAAASRGPGELRGKAPRPRPPQRRAAATHANTNAATTHPQTTHNTQTDKQRFLDQTHTKSSFYPVNDLSDLMRIAREALAGSSEERTVVMLNCGATEHVKTLLEGDGVGLMGGGEEGEAGGGNRAEGRGCEAGAVGAEGRPPRPRRAHNTRAHATPTTTTTHHHTATPPYKHNHH